MKVLAGGEKNIYQCIMQINIKLPYKIKPNLAKCAQNCEKVNDSISMLKAIFYGDIFNFSGNIL